MTDDSDAIRRLESVRAPVQGEATARPQDVGRRHRRKGAPSPATRTLLGKYQDAMRAELAAVLAELAPAPPDPGLGLVEDTPKRPALEVRIRSWDLAIKLGRELGAEVDPGPSPDGPVGQPAKRRRAGRVDYGGG